jgi:hypothetical protein
MRADVLEGRRIASSLPEWTDAPSDKHLITADQLHPTPPLGYLYQYLLGTGFVVPLPLS